MTSTQPKEDEVKALIVVDMQEDFCPPGGALPVPGGRQLVDTINELLQNDTFIIKIASKDAHPAQHISFADTHAPPNNRPYRSTITIQNPENPEESFQSMLWPKHCVEGTWGAEFVEGLHVHRFHHIVKKGTDEKVEMYSAFGSPFRNPPIGDTGLTTILRNAGITDVYVVGLAADYCVNHTALDAVKAGFRTHVVVDATEFVDQSHMAPVYQAWGQAGIGFLTMK
ncbi:Isochorismatase hydrolase [Delitschia confertaspora ATCC 74209]|uniref:nicotinamidase n=1 Tax=Delitschia confertaspora ATCC 74209 TaxID=1513339 RepID=A0A9P4MZP8_9PLEO|nr:Isochorismatase hydrolase [Delitschia confertaspora ATCC 74209]